MSEAPLTPEEFAELLRARADPDGRVNVVDVIDAYDAHVMAAQVAGE